MKYCTECGHPVELVFEDHFERYQCVDCKTLHYNNPRPCVLAIVTHKDQILFTRRIIDPGKGKWDFPGGFLERDEHPEDGLRRELDEELGVLPMNPKFLGFYLDTYTGDHISTLNIAYVCQLDGKASVRTHEFDEIQWFTIADLPGQYAFRSMHQMLEDFKEKKLV